MRFSDYKRLGKISIASRKKSTKNTVRGISFGLILLVSVIFLTFAAFISFNSEINKVRTIATFNVASKNFDDPSPSDIGSIVETNNFSVSYYGQLSYERIRSLKDSEHCLESLTANIFPFNANDESSSINYSLEGGEQKKFEDNSDMRISMNGYNSDFTSNGVRVCSLKESDNKIFLDAELEDLGNLTPFIAGEGFSENSKKQILISQQVADILDEGKNYSGLIGKSLSFTTVARLNSHEIYVEDPNNPFDPSKNDSTLYTTNVITDYIITGIIREEVFSLLTREGNEPHIWISEQSFYYEDEGEYTNLLPTISTRTETDAYDNERSYFVLSYKASHSELNSFAKNEGLFFPFVAGMRMNKQDRYFGSNIDTTLRAYNLLQGKDFSSAVDLATLITAELTTINPHMESGSINDIYQSMVYMMFSTLFTALQVVMLILYIFGGVLFVTSLLNLYNSINYSVQARRNYLGMMRAIGARDSTIPKMYFVEMVLIFMKTLVWVIIFAFLICFGLRMLVVQLMKIAGAFLLGMNLSLNLIYFPLALLIVYGVMFIIAALFALAACNSVSKKPVLDVLRTDI